MEIKKLSRGLDYDAVRERYCHFREGMPLSQSQNLAECLLSDDYVDVRWLLDTVYNINEN